MFSSSLSLSLCDVPLSLICSHQITTHFIEEMAEKYTQWADRSCGVNPFVPGEIALPKQTFGRLLRYGVALLVALPRLTAALGLALMFCAIQVVMNELLMLIVSLGLSWLYNTGHIDVKYFMPLAGFTVINLLSVSDAKHEMT